MYSRLADYHEDKATAVGFKMYHIIRRIYPDKQVLCVTKSFEKLLDFVTMTVLSLLFSKLCLLFIIIIMKSDGKVVLCILVNIS